MAQSLGGTRRGTCQIWCLTRRLCKKRRSSIVRTQEEGKKIKRGDELGYFGAREPVTLLIEFTRRYAKRDMSNLVPHP
jgi:hypothetical protein